MRSPCVRVCACPVPTAWKWWLVSTSRTRKCILTGYICVSAALLTRLFLLFWIGACETRSGCMENNLKFNLKSEIIIILAEEMGVGNPKVLLSLH